MRRIALLTDFGTRDPYVAAMKGVLASRTDAPVVDLTHEMAPFDVLGGGWFLATVVAYWPDGTIFVCVVDPGVGTSRRIVAAEQEGRTFLAPDNGLLTLVGARSFFSVENSSLFLPNGSTTFHGRDRFAPVAAALANGMPLADVGPRIESIVTLHYEPPSYGSIVHGSVVAIDRFGNVITDIEVARIPFAKYALHLGRRRDAAEPAGEDAGAPLSIDRVERNYGDASAGAFLIAGSSGHLEISIANASAAEHLGVKRLQRVELRPL